MTYRNILTEKKNKMGIIIINRPEVRNAMNGETWQELMQASMGFDADPEVAVILYSGTGDKAFIAGADLNSLKTRTALETMEGYNSGVTAAIEKLSKPTIAVINGYALGGGLEVALACDIRIAGSGAKLGQTELNVGILPGAGGTQRLARVVGLGMAKEMIFTGKIIDAEEALRIGLVNHVVPQEKLWDAAEKMAQSIAVKSPIVLKMAKIVVNGGAEVDLASGLLLEKVGQSFVFGTDDHMEGITAFLEKRTPEFTGK